MTCSNSHFESSGNFKYHERRLPRHIRLVASLESKTKFCITCACNLSRVFSLSCRKSSQSYWSLRWKSSLAFADLWSLSIAYTSCRIFFKPYLIVKLTFFCSIQLSGIARNSALIRSMLRFCSRRNSTISSQCLLQALTASAEASLNALTTLL